jgi:hypothetical protein
MILSIIFLYLFILLLNNIIKKKMVERANLGHGSLLSGGCIEKQIRCCKTSHMILSIIFLEDKHKILLHISIFYEYQQFFQHRICFSIQSQLQLVNKTMCEVLWRNISDFYVNLRVEVGKQPLVILAMYFDLGQE